MYHGAIVERFEIVPNNAAGFNKGELMTRKNDIINRSIKVIILNIDSYTDVMVVSKGFIPATLEKIEQIFEGMK